MPRLHDSGCTPVSGAEDLGTHVRYASQPIIDRTGRVVATELLFRWNRGDGHVGPELGGYGTAAVLSNALIDAELLTRTPAAEHPLGDLLVNMDARTLMSPIAETVTPDIGVIEVLETVPVDDALTRRLRELHGRGYRFALDDLQRLDDPRWALAPWVQFAKIDVADLDTARLSALVRQAHRLGLSVIAEKIEDEATLVRVRDAGADYFQGYAIARPTTTAVAALPGCDPRVIGQLLALARAGVEASSLAMLAGRHPAVVVRLTRIQALHAPQTLVQAETMEEVLQALPRALLTGWLTVLNLAATHGRDADLASQLREELAAGRRRLCEAASGQSPRAVDRATFFLCQQLLRMRLRLSSMAPIPGAEVTRLPIPATPPPTRKAWRRPETRGSGRPL